MASSPLPPPQHRIFAVSRHRPYTLVEILAVLTIFTMAAVAVAATAAGGVRIYRRAIHYSGLQTDLLLGLERMERDLRTTFAFDTIGFKGERFSVAFPGMVRRWNEFRQVFEYAPGRIVYRLDNVENTLLMNVLDYARATAEDGSAGGEERVLAGNVSALTFSYCKYDEENETYEWRQSWQPEDGMPAAVKMEIQASDAGGVSRFTRTILPPGSMMPWQPPAARDDNPEAIR